MKKYIGFIVTASLVFSLSLASFAKAENSDTTKINRSDALKSERSNVKDQMKAKREAFKEQMSTERKTFKDSLKAEQESFKKELKTKKEEFKSVNAERRKEFWKNAQEMLGERFAGAMNNLTKMQDRVGNVITKLTTEGKDATEATSALDLSKQKLAEAKSKIAEIKALLPATTEETITPEAFAKIKLLAREAKDLLKESKDALHDSIKVIKNLQEEDTKTDEGSN